MGVNLKCFTEQEPVIRYLHPLLQLANYNGVCDDSQFALILNRLLSYQKD